jgi:hypothetical protein
LVAGSGSFGSGDVNCHSATVLCGMAPTKLALRGAAVAVVFVTGLMGKIDKMALRRELEQITALDRTKVIGNLDERKFCSCFGWGYGHATNGIRNANYRHCGHFNLTFRLLPRTTVYDYTRCATRAILPVVG